MGRLQTSPASAGSILLPRLRPSCLAAFFPGRSVSQIRTPSQGDIEQGSPARRNWTTGQRAKAQGLDATTRSPPPLSLKQSNLTGRAKRTCPSHPDITPPSPYVSRTLQSCTSQRTIRIAISTNGVKIGCIRVCPCVRRAGKLVPRTGCPAPGTLHCARAALTRPTARMEAAWNIPCAPEPWACFRGGGRKEANGPRNGLCTRPRYRVLRCPPPGQRGCPAPHTAPCSSQSPQPPWILSGASKAAA